MGRYLVIVGGIDLRTVIAIIGSAGLLSRQEQKEVESLAKKLTESNFDIVTGGRSGVMRSVARGFHLAKDKANLIHIDPGWVESTKANPFNASIVRTDLGSMRNNLVVGAADIVVAVGGGAGTLSEISLAWQEKKPIFTLTSIEGWGKTVTNTLLDKRRSDAIVGFDKVDDLVYHICSICPEGVFGRRYNRGYFPHEVPAIHRIHNGSSGGAHEIHKRFGMSIELGHLTNRLVELNDEVKSNFPRTTCLVTFDDGWRDVLQVVDLFRNLTSLQPVVFVGENHFSSPILPLPLQRWYQHCAENDVSVEPLRTELKLLTEEEATDTLSSMGVETMADPDWLLTTDDLAFLRAEGWIIASHGPSHEDLRNRPQLRNELEKVADCIETRSATPWLCWPEGKWSEKSFDLAKSAGFVMQFGLIQEPHPDRIPEGMVLRNIWK